MLNLTLFLALVIGVVSVLLMKEQFARDMISFQEKRGARGNSMKAIRQWVITNFALAYCKVWMAYHKYGNQLGLGVKPVPTEETK